MKKLKEKYELVKKMASETRATQKGFVPCLWYLSQYEFFNEAKELQTTKLEIIEILMQSYRQFAHADDYQQTHKSYIAGVFLRILLQHANNACCIDKNGETVNENEALIHSRFEKEINTALKIRSTAVVLKDERINSLFQELKEASKEILKTIKEILQIGKKNEELLNKLKHLVRKNFQISSTYDYSSGFPEYSVGYDSKTVIFDSDKPLSKMTAFLRVSNATYKVETRPIKIEANKGYYIKDGFKYPKVEIRWRNVISLLSSEENDIPYYIKSTSTNGAVSYLIIDYVLPKDIVKNVKGTIYTEEDDSYHILKIQDVPVPADIINYVFNWDWNRVLY